MLSRLFKFTIVQKIISIYIVTIIIFLIYISNSYSFTENSIEQLNKTVKQQLPISELYSKNYELLEDIISIFTDTVLTNEYDLLVFMANWPTPRIDAWDSLLKARAIENMSYCIGVNRIGEDANGYQYNGHTTAYDFLGKEIASTSEGKEDLLQCVISKSKQHEIRQKLNFLNDQDSFVIQ